MSLLLSPGAPGFCVGAPLTPIVSLTTAFASAGSMGDKMDAMMHQKVGEAGVDTLDDAAGGDGDAVAAGDVAGDTARVARSDTG